MKIKNDYTNGYEIEDKVANVLEKQKKTFNEYVEELSNLIISNGIFDLEEYGNIYPEEFASIDTITINSAFAIKIMESIMSKTNFKAKLYQACISKRNDIDSNISDIKYWINELSLYRDIEMNAIYIHNDLYEIEDRYKIIESIKEILADESIDENNMINVAFLTDEIAVNENGIFTIRCPLGTKYECFEFSWPRELVLNNENCDKEERTFNEFKCWIKMPANVNITLKRGEDSITLTGEELKQAMKRPADFKTQTEESIKNLKEKYNK